MPSYFAITPASNTIRLDHQGRGEFVFTVTNTSGRAIIARARITPKDPGQQSWFKLADDPQRSYPAEKGTEQIKVRIEAPPKAVPGSYSFHLDVIAVDDPDEVFTIGPSVSFEVPAVEPNKKMPMWPILAAVVAVLVIGVALWFILSKKKVPSLVGLSQADAQAQIKNANLKIGQIAWQRTGQHVASTVISQDPAAGSAIPADQTIKLVLEQEPFVVVPNLIGKNISDAHDALVQNHLTIGSSTNQQDAPANPNTVLSQDPRADLRVAPDTAVNLVVKADTVRVPALVGKVLGDALTEISKNNLVANPVQVVMAGAVPNSVFNQIPPPTTIVPRQSVVTVYVAQTIYLPYGLATQVRPEQFNSLSPATRANIQANRVTRELPAR